MEELTTGTTLGRSSSQPSRATLVCFLLLMAVLTVSNAVLIAPYALTILMGAMLSLVFRPWYDRARKRLRATPAAVIVTTLVAAIVILPTLAFTYLAVQQGMEAMRGLSENPNDILRRVARAASSWPPVREYLGNPAEVERKLREGAQAGMGYAPQALMRIFGSLPEMALQLLFVLLSCFFFFVDGGRFVRWLHDKLPLDPEARAALSLSFRETGVSALLATVAAAAAQAVIIAAGFLALGIPVPFLAGGVTFVTAWVPILGSMPALAGGFLYAVTQGQALLVVGMVVLATAAGLADNVVHAWVLKGRGKLHPLVSLAAIFGGIHLFGLLGVFVGPVLAALFLAAANVWPIIADRFGILRRCGIVLTPADAGAGPSTPVDNGGGTSDELLKSGLRRAL